MIICISGAHRSGKSTMANDLVAKIPGLYYQNCSFGKYAKLLDSTGIQDMPFHERLTLQMGCLTLFLADLKSWSQNTDSTYITDRSPLDLITYLMAEIGMYSKLAEREELMVERYVEDCLQGCEFVNLLIMVKPLPVYEVDPTKPPPSKAYQQHIQFLVEAAAQRCPLDFDRLVHITTLDRMERVEVATKAIDRYRRILRSVESIPKAR